MSGIVVLHSGGLDSSTLLGLACRDNNPQSILSVSLSYGQKHLRELRSAQKVSNFYGVEHQDILIPSVIFQGAGSSLIDPTVPQPHRTYKELQDDFGVSPTYVPNRNAIFISIATALALVHEKSEVWVGVHAEDAHNWAYPDCTPEFVGSMAGAVYVGTYHKVRLVSPLEWLRKADVVGMGLELGVPYELTWTCYEGGDLACGKCPSCVERLEAFRMNGTYDPLPYQGGQTWEPKPTQLSLFSDDQS